MDWRENLDPKIRAYLEKQIASTGRYKNAYLNSKDPGKAQLWCALTNMELKFSELNLKVKLLEGALRDLVDKLSKKKK